MTVENSLIRKQILNQRFIRQLALKYQKELVEVLEAATRQIRRQPNNTRLQAIIDDIERTIELGLDEIVRRMVVDLNEFAVDEVDFLTKVMELNSSAVLRAPDAGKIRRALQKGELDVLTGGRTLSVDEAFNIFTRAQQDNVRQAIRDGILLGQTPTEIANNIERLGTGRSRAQINALTRTMTNHATAQSRKAFAVENQAVFDGEEWVSVLDSRTTAICGGRDGNVYPVGRGPQPPAHYNCRSLRVPVLQKDFQKVGQKSNRPDFNTWLKDQDAEFQREYFDQFTNAEEKYQLFKKGKLDIQQFRDETGKVYTLEEMQALYPAAFRDAGIEL